MKKILIVEDDPTIGKILREWLIDLDKDTVVDIDMTGECASKLKNTNPKYDIIFLDNSLPKANGVEIVTTSESKEFLDKIILFSGSIEVHQINKDNKFVMLDKPFAPEDVELAVSKFQERLNK